MILTAPFVSLTHFAPYHYCTGFSRYYFQWHLGMLGLEIVELVTNGGYFDLLAQEVLRFDSAARIYSGKRLGIFERFAVRVVVGALRRRRDNDRASWELGCFGLHLRARRKEGP